MVTLPSDIDIPTLITEVHISVQGYSMALHDDPFEVQSSSFSYLPNRPIGPIGQRRFTLRIGSKRECVRASLSRTATTRRR